MELLITVFIVIFLVVWLLGKLFPFLLRLFIKRKFGIDTEFNNVKSSKNDYHKYSDVEYDGKDASQTAEEKKKGVVTEIVITEEKEKIINEDLGEYVEFEEVGEVGEDGKDGAKKTSENC